MHPTAYWVAQNIVLEINQLGFESDSGRFKVGNGRTAWNTLTYAPACPIVLDNGNATSTFNPSSSIEEGNATSTYSALVTIDQHSACQKLF
jgi:hypothetical protein